MVLTYELVSPSPVRRLSGAERVLQPKMCWLPQTLTFASHTCWLVGRVPRMCWLVADGNRVDKGFKNSHYNRCAKVVNKRFHVNFNGSQIFNHLKTWRTRWNTIVTLNKLSSTHFINDETGTIMLDEENYLARVQVPTLLSLNSHYHTKIRNVPY